jgi:carbonic anhydrase
MVRQLQFHSGSETRVNGEQFALELHVMHENQQGSKLVLSVLFAKGAANSWLDSLGWSKRLPAAQQELPIDGAVSILDVLPTARQYYAYMGSLTTPPCTEGVQWVVMRERVSISEAQLGAFPTKGNFRPPQALNGRSVSFLSKLGASSFTWGYNGLSGPGQWASIGFPMCQGQLQSPINIETPTVVRSTVLAISLDQYKPSSLTRLHNDGRCLEVVLVNGGALTFDGQAYIVERIVFRRKSETRVDGQQFALEAQIEHRGTESGRKLIVSVLFASGATSSVLLQACRYGLNLRMCLAPGGSPSKARRAWGAARLKQASSARGALRIESELQRRLVIS